MHSSGHKWDQSTGVKYQVSKFEEEEFKKWFEKGGKEKLSKQVNYFDYSPKESDKKKEGRYWK